MRCSRGASARDARVTVESELTWDRYVARLGDLLEAARG